jgi:hypothetical protein
MTAILHLLYENSFQRGLGGIPSTLLINLLQDISGELMT